jgi:hypothetical protein
MNIENQFPEYIREQFPDFVRFVELYFDFLNSAEIVYSSGIGNLAIDSILTGDVSSTTTKITGIDPTNNRIFVTKQNSLVIGESLSDGSGNSCKIVSYTPNPSQTISELLNYKNLDETRSTLFEKYRSDLMTVIPNRLEKSVDIPNLIKNIKSLYVQKGTTESYKTLFSLLFNEYVEIYYPAYDMLELSAGEWSGRYSIEVDVVSGNPFSIIAADVTLTTPTFKSVVTHVSYIRRISFTRFEMYFQDRIEDAFAVEGTSIVGSGFTGAIPASTSIVSYGGEHTDNKGFVSDSNYLQNKYYQKYSYVVKSNVVPNSYKSIIKGALHPAGLVEFDELVITNLLSVSDALRVLKARFIKSFNEGLDTTDDALLSIFKTLIDSISITDLYAMGINKDISGDSIGFSHIQYFDLNPYAVDYFNQPAVGTDAYTDSRI